MGLRENRNYNNSIKIVGPSADKPNQTIKFPKVNLNLYDKRVLIIPSREQAGSGVVFSHPKISTQPGYMYIMYITLTSYPIP